MWPALLLATTLVAGPALAAPAPSTEEPPNLVVIVWDDADLARLGFLRPPGPDEASSTPTLDRLAGEGLVFPDGRVPLDRARPALGALLTGEYPQVSHITTHVGSRVYAGDSSLPRRLQAAGWATFCAGRFKEGNPLKGGFDAAAADVLATEADTLTTFLAEDRGDRPLFLWWAPAAPTTERDPGPTLDAALARVVADLEANGLLANTLFAFLTDGEADTNGLPADVASAARVRTPLFVRAPGQARTGRSTVPATVYDLNATLLDFAGLAPGATPAGRSLRPLCAGAAPELEQALAARPVPGVWFERQASRASKGGQFPEKDVVVMTWREGDLAYGLYLGDVGLEVDSYAGTASVGHAAGDQTLFDLAADPEQERDLSGRPDRAEQVEAMRGRLLDWWTSTGGGELRLPYLTPALGPPPTEPRPNIVLVLSDDQDYEHLGFLGHPLGHQPTLDALAKEGLVFPVGHVPMSRCRPSQAGLLSGRWPHETDIVDNHTAHLLTRRDSLPNLLKAAGYATFQGGKMWEGSSQSMGFLEPTTLDLHFLRFVREGQQELFDFIDRYHDERPLFVWWAPTLPHVPHDPPARLAERFRDTPVALPEGFEGDAEAYRAAERSSYAMEAWFDEGLGALVEKLRAVGELDDTLLVFLIDNGWSNGYPSKGTAFEKGLRTPIVFTWKNGVTGGRTDERLVSSLDVYATILEVAGVPRPMETRGISLAPVLAGGDAPRREVLYGAQYLYHPRPGPARPERDVVAIHARTERWKYVLYLKDVDDPEAADYQVNFCAFPARARGERDLFDLAADPHELHDLSDDPANAARMAEMEAGLLAWWKDTGGAALDLPGANGDNPRPSRRRQR